LEMVVGEAEKERRWGVEEFHGEGENEIRCIFEWGFCSVF
jgi:hypothetical protein